MLRIISQRNWLAEAARITLSSKGALTAGIDGVHKDSIVVKLEQYLGEIRIDLLAGDYEPQPARRVYIPKIKR